MAVRGKISLVLADVDGTPKTLPERRQSLAGCWHSLRGHQRPPATAIKMVKERAKAKFDETIEVAIPGTETTEPGSTAC